MRLVTVLSATFSLLAEASENQVMAGNQLKECLIFERFITGENESSIAWDCELADDDLTSADGNRFVPIINLPEEISSTAVSGVTTFLSPSSTISKDGIMIPPGSEYTLGTIVHHHYQESLSSSDQRKLSLYGERLGTRRALVVRIVNGNNGSPVETTWSQAHLSDEIFGVSGDPVNMKSQFEACSAGAMTVEPVSHSSVTDGVITVNIDVALTGGDISGDQANAVVTELESIFGAPLEDYVDHVLICNPPGSYFGAAWAHINGMLSTYNDNVCPQVTFNMHEVGHNLGLFHSSENGEYDDQSGLMGFSYNNEDDKQMCFNAAKSWQLGWYDAPSRRVTFHTAWSGTIVGVAEYALSTLSVLIKIPQEATGNNYYINFNRAVGMNADTQDGIDQVLITSSRWDPYGDNVSDLAGYSYLKAKLSAGESYTIANFNNKPGLTLTVDVHAIDLSTTPATADLSIELTCASNSDCDDNKACNGIETCDTSTNLCVPGVDTGTCPLGPYKIFTPFCGACFVQPSNMFDIEVNNADIDITGLQYSSYGGNYIVEVYTKTGTHVGSEQDPTAWELVGTATSSAPRNEMGEIVFSPGPIRVTAGGRQAFYIHHPGGLKYGAGSDINTVTTDNDYLSIYEGKASSAKFGGTFVAPEIWSGEMTFLELQYGDPGTNGDPIILGLQKQVFKFDGQDGAWYSNLAIKNYLQWNMQFKRFNSCPIDADMFISSMSLSTSTLSLLGQESNILIVTTPEPIPECSEDPNKVCLGDGTLHISLDGGETFLSEAGEYQYGSQHRVVAHNTYGACSRKWHDYDITSNDNNQLREGGRRTSVVQEKKPLSLLMDHKYTMIDPLECDQWIEDRWQRNDLFQQRGQWSTIYIETPLVSFHVEYRRSDWFHKKCDFQSLDAWMTTVSKTLEEQPEWQGILGETKHKIYHEQTGSQIKSDRLQLLRGKDDADYEVNGPFGKEFAALDNGHGSFHNLMSSVIQTIF
eukprot:CAMPEP_0194213942 /NCGR_PEP_ID=MMETSP0156-20130528/14882_1 /TAXON_ID=33649 /ORGANISM="Thalassionema nitzschioides, Strain L26-B" /LENGTH=981 /DNA_ID=CAMNT_0038942091 /DNA_START=51 /DNA_END=2996 /DNA_ORIENTATION=+